MPQREWTDEQEHTRLLAELGEAGQAHRLHVTLMFGHVVVYLTLMAGVLYRLSDATAPLSTSGRAAIGLAGALVSTLFIVMHERIFTYSSAARNRAEEVQDLLGASLYHPRPSRIGAWFARIDRLNAGASGTLQHHALFRASTWTFVVMGFGLVLCVLAAFGIIQLDEIQP